MLYRAEHVSKLACPPDLLLKFALFALAPAGAKGFSWTLSGADASFFSAPGGSSVSIFSRGSWTPPTWGYVSSARAELLCVLAFHVFDSHGPLVAALLRACHHALDRCLQYSQLCFLALPRSLCAAKRSQSLLCSCSALLWTDLRRSDDHLADDGDLGQAVHRRHDSARRPVPHLQHPVRSLVLVFDCSRHLRCQSMFGRVGWRVRCAEVLCFVVTSVVAHSSARLLATAHRSYSQSTGLSLGITMTAQTNVAYGSYPVTRDFAWFVRCFIHNAKFHSLPCVLAAFWFIESPGNLDD